jgi:hypothetical protein
MRRPALLAIALLAVAGCTHRPSTVSYAWEGTLGEDAWVRIRNTNGRVEVRRSPDERVIVGAEVRTGGRQTTWVRDSAADAMTFCVVFGDAGRPDCDRLGRGQHSGFIDWVRRLLSGGSGEAQVRYVIYVPPDARVDVRTMNGAIDLQSVARDFRAHTINGKVTAVAVTSGMDIEAVNGSIDARIDLEGDGDLSFKTVNGSITAELPASLEGDVQLSTVNGSVTSDFALEGAGRKQLHGTIGGGGRDVLLKTVNGRVTLKRRG